MAEKRSADDEDRPLLTFWGGPRCGEVPELEELGADTVRAPGGVYRWNDARAQLVWRQHVPPTRACA